MHIFMTAAGIQIIQQWENIRQFALKNIIMLDYIYSLVDYNRAALRGIIRIWIQKDPSS